MHSTLARHCDDDNKHVERVDRIGLREQAGAQGDEKIQHQNIDAG